jgi:hypothetical protein
VYDTSTNAILGVPRQLWEQLATVERDASQQPAANEAVTALQAERYLQPCEVRTMQFYSPGIEGEPHAVPAPPMARPRGVERRSTMQANEVLAKNPIITPLDPKAPQQVPGTIHSACGCGCGCFCSSGDSSSVRNTSSAGEANINNIAVSMFGGCGS